jgi:hypothetical protein
MRKLLLSTVAVAALAVYSAPTFAADTMSVVRGDARVVTDRDKIATPTATTDHKTIIRDLDRSITIKSHGKPVPQGQSTDRNIAYVDQVGNNNINTQTQGTGKNLSVVSQGTHAALNNGGSFIGTGANEAIVDQTSTAFDLLEIERSVSFVEQAGTNNEVKVFQSGKQNKAVMLQNGIKNGWDEDVGEVSSEQSQTGNRHEAYATATGAWNFSSQRQHGADTKSSIDQNSNIAVSGRYANVARTDQTGGFHEAVITQTGGGAAGSGNFATTTQAGSGNYSIQSQKGTGNGISGTSFSGVAAGATTGAYISQNGDNHTAGQFQYGDFNLASIDQTDGTNNVAAQFQFGDRNKASVTQAGSNNIGMQVQNGNNHTAILSQSGLGSNVSTQVQSGSLNYANTMQHGSANRSTQTQN